MTERTRMRFVVKQTASEKPFLACEPLVENLSILDRGFLSFDLRPGASFEEAEAIARDLNEKIAAVAYTTVPGWGEKR